MGHFRRTEAPSPVQILSILAAKERGVPYVELSRRTKHSISTIQRWWDQWRKDVAFWENIACECPEVLSEHHFDILYPDVGEQALMLPLEPKEPEAEIHTVQTLHGPIEISYAPCLDTEEKDPTA